MPTEKASTRYTPDTEATYVKGVGPKLAEKLAKIGIRTVEDLLYYVPKRHEDRSSFTQIIDLAPGEPATIKGSVISLTSRRVAGGMNLTQVHVDDGTGAIALVFFNQPYLRVKFEKMRGEIIVYGMVQAARWGLQITSPEWEEVEDEAAVTQGGRIVPVYGLTEGIGQRQLRRVMHGAVHRLAGVLPENLPASVRRRQRFKPLEWCIRQAHFPDTMETQQEGRRRLVFEEFFHLQLLLALRRAKNAQQVGIAFDIPPGFLEEASERLPFALTGAQKRALGQILDDMRGPHPMNRLLQGDVGSGKTAVAACAIMAAARNGYQSALMAPTEILADQHGRVLRELLEPAGIEVELLIGRFTARQKEKVRARLAAGHGAVAVGTHALIQETVSFDRLGLIIIDEQHRFGVMQRAALIGKGVTSDVLVMTATPIPRTMTMALYGDLDLSIIDELPPGRRPVKTHWKLPGERQQVYDGVRELVRRGRQAFVVCPLVTESEKLQVQAAEEHYKRLRTAVFPDLRLGLLHGQMKGDDKDAVMGAFRAGELDILVTTSVIEVGVDVPNAGAMVIEDAHRFGLAQLHQLRGRVGRSEHQAYCVLIAEAPDEKTRQRMEIMTRTSDGFVIAEEDLRIRGPGEVYGTKQSGLPDFQVADLIADQAILAEARKEAFRLVAEGSPAEMEETKRHLTRIRNRWGLVEIS